MDESGADDLGRLAEGILDAASRAAAQGPPSFVPDEIGRIIELSKGMARVRGLPGLGYGELVAFDGGGLGMALDLGEEEVAVALLNAPEALGVGKVARRSGRPVDVPVGPAVLGRIVDPLGRPLDGGPPPAGDERLPVERPAAPIVDRAPVERPLQTGTMAVDALVPIGRGQRELIIGDRQLGKTALALSAIVNQRGSGVISVYCSIGQQGSSVAKAVAGLRAEDALRDSIVVVAGGEDPPGLQFIAPYAAFSIAEWFMERGRDTLVVLDDLSRHARSYRELSLLMRRPPAREAYPGDIFYIHSRLLERATHLGAKRGGGSLTALPIVETEAQNIAAYIPTNLVSITDGQIYLSPRLFQQGRLPAIDVGLSVSRVGGRAQAPAYASVAADLKIAYSRFEELEMFERFSSRLDEATRRVLDRGKRIREILRQDEGLRLDLAEQLAVLAAVVDGAFDGIALERVREASAALRTELRGSLSEVALALEGGAGLDATMRGRIDAAARRAAAGTS